MALTHTKPRAHLPWSSEIRNMIYRLLLTTSRCLVISTSGTFRYAADNTLVTDDKPYIDVIRLSKTTLAEALPIFYHVNTFYMKSARSLSFFCRSTKFARSKLGRIRHLALDGGHLVNKTRIKELTKLPHLKRLTLVESWASTDYWESMVFDPITGDEKVERIQFDEVRRAIKHSPMQCELPSELKDLITSRPNIKYEVMLEGEFDVIDYFPPSQLSQESSRTLSALFSMIYGENAFVYQLHYEKERLQESGSTWDSYLDRACV